MQIYKIVKNSSHSFLLSIVSLMFIFLFNNCSKFETTNNKEESSSSGSSTKAGPFVCTDPKQTSPSLMRRLSVREINNTLLVLLGKTIHGEIQTAVQALPNDRVVADISEFENRFYADQIELLLSLTEQIATRVLSTPANKESILGKCSTLTTVTESCVKTFISSFGLKVFRKPLGADDIKSFWDLYALGAASSIDTGFRNVLMALFIRPEFLYHLELGDTSTAATDSTDFEITSYELASRLSYLLWDSAPDSELFDLASTDQLKKPDVLLAQVDRMLKNNLAKDKIRGFFDYWLDLNRQYDIPTTGFFLQGLNTVGLKSEAIREMYQFIDHIVLESEGNFKDLMTSRRSFAQTSALAQIHGHTLSTNSTEIKMVDENRMGLLMRLPVLVSGDDQTHPILRGVKFRRRVLCDNLPNPGPEIILTRPPEEEQPDPFIYTIRDITTENTKSLSCMGCHSIINPLGFAFEGFDSIGRYRTKELVYDSKGNLMAQHNINTRVEPMLSAMDKTATNDAVELVQSIANDSDGKGAACMVRQIYRFYQFKNESQEDNCLLADIYSGLNDPNGSILKAIRTSVLNRFSTNKKILNENN